MKKLLIIIIGIVFIVLPINVNFGKVWRVDNNATNKPDFTNLQAAHDAVNAGDTLYIAGHGNSYSGLVINKQIVIIGTGYFLDQNINKGVNPFESKIDQIITKSGAENSIIMSCTIGFVEIQCNNIILKRNRILGAYNRTSVYNTVTCSGVIVHQCFIKSGISLAGDNFLITNNFIQGNNVEYLGPVALSFSSSGRIKNNIISGYEHIQGAVVENNVFISTINRLENCIERNNIVGEVTDLFTLTGNEDANYILKEGSPAKGAGVNGVDCGMFGGDDPYVLSGLPPIPTIYEATVPNTATSKDGLPVKIKARTNK